MLRSNFMQTRHELDPYLESSDDDFMVVFRDSDIQKGDQHTELRRSDKQELACSADNLGFNVDPNHPVYTTMLKRDVGYWGSSSLANLFGKRQIDTVPTGGNSGSVNLKLSIGSTNGCPNTRKVALIGVAADCSYVASFTSTEAARQNVIHQINSASAVYEKTFNITLGLQNLTVVEGNCPGTAPPATPWNIGCGNTSITDRLNTFSQWRGQRNDKNAYWTLLTNCATGAEVGLAWLGQLCVSNVIAGSRESVSGANVVARTSTEWQVIAHESGHTFGAVHDCNSQTCNDGTSMNAQLCCPKSTTTCDAGSQFIMNPSTGNDISAFSACTVGNICSALLRNSVNSSCLSDNKGVTTLASEQSCGNGIVEGNEQCDCGGVAGCGNNSCCDGATCKFKNNAVCDPANDECCIGCQFAAQGTVCRASTGSCNPQEVCSGTAATCPTDQVAPNGQDCGNGLTCASGQCTSRDQQCKTLMGSFTTNNDTYACNHQDCTLSCASPQFGPGQCYSMQQNFLDGTACGGGGTCTNVILNFSPFLSPLSRLHTNTTTQGRMPRIQRPHRGRLLDQRQQTPRHRHCRRGRRPHPPLHCRLHYSALSSAPSSFAARGQKSHHPAHGAAVASPQRWLGRPRVDGVPAAPTTWSGLEPAFTAVGAGLEPASAAAGAAALCGIWEFCAAECAVCLSYLWL